MFKFKLGQKVRDTITGFEGIITARVEYLNGCLQYCIRPTYLEKGEMIDGQYLDESRLEKVEEEIPLLGDVMTAGPTGGDMPNTPPSD